MQTRFLSAGLTFVAGAITLSLATIGCTSTQTTAGEPGATPAPAPAFSPGIGGTGPESADTRAVGTTATGEANGDINAPETPTAVGSGRGGR